jgi:bifunctional pyridoxal-dependent enzyme with beta-cystathionase and maltose regulon repressor activities
VGCATQRTYRQPWIDACALPVKNRAGFFEDAGVSLYGVALFDASDFFRLNFACPRPLLAKALERIKAGVRQLR